MLISIIQYEKKKNMNIKLTIISSIKTKVLMGVRESHPIKISIINTNMQTEQRSLQYANLTIED